MDAAFGGDIDIGAGDDSYGRFVRMAALIRDYNPQNDGRAAEYAFRILDDVSSDETLRSVVYDAGRGRVFWKTRDNDKVRWLDFSVLDLAVDSPTQILDVDAGGPGDASELLEGYTIEANRALVNRVLKADRQNPKIIDKLKGRGLTFDAAVELIIQNPTKRN